MCHNILFISPTVFCTYLRWCYWMVYANISLIPCDLNWSHPDVFVTLYYILSTIYCLWMDKQHWVLWPGPCGTRRQAGEFISGPELATGAWLLSFNRTQSRVVIGLLTGHNTLRRQLYVTGLSDNLTCRKCGTEEETSVHVLCECEALASLRHAHLGSFILDPEDIRKLSIGANWNLRKGTGLL